MSRIDVDRLRDDLENYYGTAAFSGFPQAIIDLGIVERASEEELISIARKCGFNIDKYIEREDTDYYR